ncbi:MAG TPA: ABC transporter substrate-binding protein [Gaiellaceae bacterium]|nr:ABC transporter substrate-binding protein [Gaiellaceae bacterium]
MSGSTRKSSTIIAFVAVLLLVLLGAGAVGASTGRGDVSAKDNVIRFTSAFGTQFAGPNFNPYSGASDGSTQLMFLPLEVWNFLKDSFTPMIATRHRLLGTNGVEFTLRPGMKWSDGRPITAKDVIFSFTLLQKHPALDSFGVMSHVASVRASGRTVTFTYKGPNSQVHKLIANTWIVPSHQWTSVSDPVTFANATPIVSGPYALGRYTSTRIILKRNPRFFAASTVVIPEMHATPMNPATNLQDLAAGRWDWAAVGDPNPGGLERDWVSRDRKHNRYWIVPFGIVTMYLNTAKAPFNDAAFRQALSYGLDRALVGKRATPAGYSPPAAQTGLLPHEKAWLDPSIPNAGRISHDPTKARAILAAAGYKLADGRLLGKDGKPISFTLQIPNGFNDWIAGAQVIKKQWGELGIDLTIDTPQIPAVIGSLVTGNYDAVEWITAIDGGPYFNLNQVLNSRLTADIGQPAPANWGRYRSNVADRLLAQVVESGTLAGQKKALHRLQRIVYNRVPFLELTYFPLWYEFRTDKYVGWPDAKNPYSYGNPPPGGIGPKRTWMLLVVTNLRRAEA